jgi:SPP1 gp7 family putative phage head morphogenesis protein
MREGVYMSPFQFKPVPHEEAARIIADRLVVSRDVFKRMLPEIRARQFLISGVEDMNVVQQIRDLIAEIPRGGGWEEAKGKIIEQLGPWMDPEAAEKRAILLMRHHGFQAYAAAQHEQMVEQIPVMPYWKYLTMGDENVRDSHAALHGLILPADDPFWATHYPPWDWGCRCQVVPVLESEYREAVGDGRVAGKRTMGWNDRTKGWALGPQATNALRNGRLDMGDGMPVDVRAPVQRATSAQERAAAYQWNPGDLRLDLDQLRARYDAETFATFERQAKAAKLEDGRTVWQWLEAQG